MSEFEGEAFTSTREAQQARQGTCGPGALALRPSPSCPTLLCDAKSRIILEKAEAATFEEGSSNSVIV
jgi:hypothetical protein